ncbi:hypothetical protein J6TS2_50530 [Heyndrickxia sporothermodurans]|nr:hypothetical protein J6TS2_50530 [Heyndrickxia sporothermodurans]
MLLDSVILPQLKSEIKSFLDDFPNTNVEEICASFDISLMFAGEVTNIVEEWKGNEY